MHHATDDETTDFKDRERRRSNASHTRQSLGAVGRVASRVRNSGMSKLTKANSFMQRQKEEEGDAVNESPWGVGVSAVAKVETNSSEESRQCLGNDKTGLSPREERNSDMVELSSPLSTDQLSPSRQIDRTVQNGTKEEDWPLSERTTDRMGTNRIGSDRKADKRIERGTGVLAAAGAARGLVKSVSKFGFRSNEAKSKNQNASSDLTNARSALAIPSNDLRKARSARPQITKRTSGPNEDAGRQRSYVKEHDSIQTPPETEAVPDTRVRGFHLPGLGRGKVKPEGSGNKSRTGEKSRLDMPQGKSKAGVEKSRGRSGLARSISHAPAASPKADPDERNSPRNGPDSGKSHDGKKNKNRKSFKDPEQKARKGRASWFGFSAEVGHNQTRGAAQNRGKANARRQPSFEGYDPDSELGTRTTAKASKHLAEMGDFAIDEYFDSEEDDMETASAPRSMVDDDFITYQTGKGKKAQGNRSKSRMRPHT